MSVRLESIVPWGRSFDEYRLMFGLSEAELNGSILGCGDGPASFNAEMIAQGRRVISCDPIYAFSATDIRRRFDECADQVISQVKLAPGNYVWSYHRSPDDLLSHRRRVIDAFLIDYPRGVDDGRYVVGSLPELPFGEGQFHLALVSHLLFLYSELLSREFHLASIDDLCRVAREVRIFPLVGLDCQESPHVEAVVEHARRAAHLVEIEKVPYHLQKNGDRMMRIRSRSCR